MNIYVGNLAFQVTEEELRREFMAFGRVTSVIVVSDKDTGGVQSWRYAFVEMTSSAEAHAAIDGLQGLTLKGVALHLVEALPLSKRAPYRSQRSKTALSSREKARARDY